MSATAAVAGPSAPPMGGLPTVAYPTALRAPLAMVDRMIRSGEFDLLFTALKGFRSGVVYGTRVRAPHALALNLVWSKAPYSSMPGKIYQVTKTHALGLGFSSVIYACTRGLLKRLQGREAGWHIALGGFLVGFFCWGDVGSAVHIQMMMYMLSRIVCALYHLVAAKYKLQLPNIAFRVYMGALYSMVMVLLATHPDTLQSSMRQSLEYIFLNSRKFTSWYDVFVVNTAGSL